MAIYLTTDAVLSPSPPKKVSFQSRATSEIGINNFLYKCLVPVSYMKCASMPM